MPASAIELARASSDHDLARLRAALPADLVVHDHRRTGIGRIEAAEAWIASVVALCELSPNVRIDDLYHAGVAPHGRVSVGRMSGTNAEGGEFESCLIRLFQYPAERVVGIEVFEVEDVGTAPARFEELRTALTEATESAWTAPPAVLRTPREKDSAEATTPAYLQQRHFPCRAQSTGHNPTLERAKGVQSSCFLRFFFSFCLFCAPLAGRPEFLLSAC